MRCRIRRMEKKQMKKTYFAIIYLRVRKKKKTTTTMLQRLSFDWFIPLFGIWKTNNKRSIYGLHTYISSHIFAQQNIKLLLRLQSVVIVRNVQRRRCRRDRRQGVRAELKTKVQHNSDAALQNILYYCYYFNFHFVFMLLHLNIRSNQMNWYEGYRCILNENCCCTQRNREVQRSHWKRLINTWYNLYIT